ncbi:MAG: hypothetical protein ACRDD7_11065 [Peptostreptococcaceae bacterium]
MNKIITKDDINGFFGLLMNNLTNLLVITSLLIVVVGLPKEIVYQNVLPGLGIALFFASVYYTYMGYKLRRDTGDIGVTALPSGVSVPHMYLIVFMVIGPVFWSTNNPYLAWYCGIAWCFIEGIVELCGVVFGKKIREIIPRPALLGSLAGVSLTFILINPAFNIFSVPYIGLITFTFVLLSLFGKVKMPWNLPIGLIAIIFGIIVGYLTKMIDGHVLNDALKSVSIITPKTHIAGIIEGLQGASGLLAMAIPFGIYNFIETIDNVESAAAAGDDYNLTEALLVDGTSTIISSIMGSPFPIAVYIGHPGWKQANAKIGYTLLTGIAILIITLTGSLEVLLSLIPIVAIEPILIYIGLIIVSQAFETSNSKYYPAIIVAFIPWLADWSQNVVDIAFTSSNTTAIDLGMNIINQNGLNYEGMLSLGSGSIIVSILWSTITIFIIDNRFDKLVITSAIAILLSFFGIIHSDVVKFNANLEMSIAYFMMLIIFIIYHIKYKNTKGKNKNEKHNSTSKTI